MIAATVVACISACSSQKQYEPPALAEERPAADGGMDSGPSTFFPITGINSGTLTVTGVEPATGPFSGGTTAVVRGSGFDDSVTIHVGGIAVQPGEIKRDDKNRITIVVPAGRVGPADVEVTQGDTTIVLPDAFMYNGLAVSPDHGAAAGGSLVNLTISGIAMPDDATFDFDGLPCTEVHVASPQAATCKTPAHDPGLVDVTARSASQASFRLVAQKSYTFAETLDVAGGGLSGGPINGTLNVTVVSDGPVGNVIPKALVLLGNDPKNSPRGLTDKRGAYTFSDVDLKGPVTLHVNAKCFQRASIVSFDATDVTVLLSPALDPSCSADGDIGPGVKQLAATVSGELIFPGHEEFAVNTWDIVPQPKSNEIRVAYVFTTQGSVDVRPIAPDGMGTELARLVEGSALPGKRGYIYRITSRAAGLAVFALAGIERVDTREFTPYVMGIAHDVVTSPGEETKNVDMTMTITLDRELDVSLSDIPARTPEGPDEFLVRAYVDLGAEGLILRDVNNTSYDMISRHTGNELFRFYEQPAFVGGLSNASYYVLAGYYANNPESLPYTRQKRTGVRASSDPVHFDNFLGYPTVEAPVMGARIPDDRTLRFKLEGPQPDLIVADIYGGDGMLAWTEVLPGDAREVPIPDFSMIDGQSDIAPGYVRWVITAVQIDDFRYNEFQYTYLVSRYWTHDSGNMFIARR